jgi:hypothetical protein
VPARQSTPVRRAAAKKKQIDSLRRKYNLNTSRRLKLLPAEVPHVEQMVVVLKLANYSKTQISKIVGISYAQVTEILAQPRINEEIAILRKKIAAAALELLQDFMIEAVMVLVDVMRTSQDDAMRIKASESLLDRGGVVKISRSERVDEERITVSDDGLLEKLREAPVEVQEQAAQLIEQLEGMLGGQSK